VTVAVKKKCAAITHPIRRFEAAWREIDDAAIGGINRDIFKSVI
jgi:hypothetical protein